MRASKREEELPREKYVFLVRHAQSTWNQNVDMVKTISRGDFNTQSITMKDVVCRAARLPYMARSVWHKDHPISEEGVGQTEELRRKIAAMRQKGTETTSLEVETAEGSSFGSSGSAPARRSEREKRYYDRFLMKRQQIYCSPLLRALQTAHLALPAEDGWGAIKLLKDAREFFRLRIERDCLGARGIVGTQIIDRAMRMGQELPGLEDRCDASDCLEKWWSEEPETEADVEARLKTLWRRLLEEDGDDSCVLVTHSNLIKALLMHFGSVDEESEQAICDADLNANYCGGGQSSERRQMASSQEGPSGGYRAEQGSSAGGWARQSSAPAASESWRDSFREAWRGLATSAVERKVNLDREIPVDPGTPEPDSEPEESETSWAVVARSSDAMRTLKSDKLQNCGVLGLHCVLEAPMQRCYREVDGWIDLDESHAGSSPNQLLPEPRWVARDALLMFDSVLVK